MPDGPPSSATARERWLRCKNFDARFRPARAIRLADRTGGVPFWPGGQRRLRSLRAPRRATACARTRLCRGWTAPAPLPRESRGGHRYIRRPGLGERGSGACAGEDAALRRNDRLHQLRGAQPGSALANGWRSLIVVADSNGSPTHSFLALKIQSRAKPRAIPPARALEPAAVDAKCFAFSCPLERR